MFIQTILAHIGLFDTGKAILIWMNSMNCAKALSTSLLNISMFSALKESASIIGLIFAAKHLAQLSWLFFLDSSLIYIFVRELNHLLKLLNLLLLHP